jgi:FADH2 O2-dependent halogenase
MSKQPYDVGIVGSGFSGSLLAWILASAGRRVFLLDRSQHPRFAIGESSTPLADLLIEQLADKHGLPALGALSRWGSWQRELPQLIGGKKRGFSYYAHRRHQPYRDSTAHEQSLLVAASASDDQSDTHWLRSDVDAWLFQQAQAAGVEVVERMDGITLAQQTCGWQVTGTKANQTLRLDCRFVVDATGSGGLLADVQNLDRLDDRLLTANSALFGHFRHVGSMTDWQRAAGIPIHDDPFDGDAAAQHHWLDDGWLWMLRFDEGTTSVGIVRPTARWLPLKKNETAADRWSAIVEQYPTLAELMGGAELIAPATNEVPTLGWIPRISRLWSQAAGDGWAMLPNTAGIVDPLHSTGIAHAVSGVERLARILLSSDRSSAWSGQLAAYSRDVIDEVIWIDRLIHICYQGAEQSFAWFTALTSLYFVAAIHNERELAAGGSMPRGFLLSRSADLRQVLDAAEGKIVEMRHRPPSAAAADDLIDWLRPRLAAWNDVGLLDPGLHNRIARSVAPK